MYTFDQLIYHENPDIPGKLPKMQEISHVRAVLWIDVGYRSSDFQTILQTEKNITNYLKHLEP